MAAKMELFMVIFGGYSCFRRRSMSSRMASAGARPSSRTAYICAVMGIAMPWRRASARVAAVVPMPSATMRMPLRTRPAGGPCRAHADGAIAARKRAGGREDQVAKASEAGGQVALAAEGYGEAGHLGEAAGDQRGDGIGALPAEPGADAGGDGYDVFHCASDFNSREVAIGVQAQRGAGKSCTAAATSGSVEATTTAVGSPRATSRAKLAWRSRRAA